ncbi:histidine kinase [marine bacterium AO1-C]|nr:histidine kinase [marine bacterium AO1-C]
MKLNPSVKHHLIIGAFICGWAFMFTFFARPFAHGSMDLKRWLQVSAGFSFTAFFAYAVITFVQQAIYQKLAKWTVLLEISMYVLYYTVYTVITYYYYRSPIITGFYDFQTFFVKIILNILLIYTPIIIAARYNSLRKITREENQSRQLEPKDEDVIIRGTNKLDFLKIKQSELVCISNTQNYVEVFFLENGALQTKLIRNSLKKIQEDLGFLIQVHRSHLINPQHFRTWKDAHTILLTQKELPVSKTYKEGLLSLQNS